MGDLAERATSETVIRRMVPGDLEAADAMLRAAFSSPVGFLPRLRRYLAIQPDSWFLAERDGAVIGTAGAIRYGGFAYIGMMAVEPALQGRGLGRRLLEHLLGRLEAAGIGCAILDATDEGAPLYERLGFVDAGRSEELVEAVPPLSDEPDEAGAVETEVATDLQEVIDLDRALFGADRAPLWRYLAGEDPARILVARPSAGGPALGYLCVQSPMLGPWGAHSPEAARALLAAARRLPSATPRRVQVPSDNTVARDLLTAAGFVDLRAPRHMRRGSLAAAPRWPAIYGKGSFCLG
jgi:ribosomal protein S18 acetylase RimI-like enzyme